MFAAEQVRSIIRVLEHGFRVLFLDLDVNPTKSALSVAVIANTDLV
jgi:hypothetical protein